MSCRGTNTNVGVLPYFLSKCLISCIPFFPDFTGTIWSSTTITCCPAYFLACGCLPESSKLIIVCPVTFFIPTLYHNQNYRKNTRLTRCFGSCSLTVSISGSSGISLFGLKQRKTRSLEVTIEGKNYFNVKPIHYGKAGEIYR